jgi:diguanylate cyclase (GGDEF)-like protein
VPVFKVFLLEYQLMKKDFKKETDWQSIQDELAEESGLAVIVHKEEGLVPLYASNNNSICRQLISSREFSSHCERFCGKVYSSAIEEDKALRFQCHAGLECVAVPIKISENQKLVAITGRAFTKSDNYRVTTERAISGDLSKFSPKEFFENVLITSSSQKLENLARRLSMLSADEKRLLEAFINERQIPEKEKTEGKNKIPVEEVQKVDPRQIEERTTEKKLHRLIEKFNRKKEEHTAFVEKVSKRQTEDLVEFNAWRKLFSSLTEIEYGQACEKILEFLQNRYEIASLAWLESRNNHLDTLAAIGKLKKQQMQVSIAGDDPRLIQALSNESPLELRERKKKNDSGQPQLIKLFPVAVGNLIKSALVIGDGIGKVNLNRQLIRFCRAAAPELEILRLKNELARRSWLGNALNKFNDNLKMIDTEDFWSRLVETTAELLRAERGSLFVYDEDSEKLVYKAAFGTTAEAIKKGRENIGDRILNRVWESGEPLAVPNITEIGITPAPPDWKYKSHSFICFPLKIAGRKIGVLNLADKVDGGVYDEFDLRLLLSIAPQIAVAIDRANLKNMAGEFEQLSVTDALTGLLNRRYLEKRLDEELKRSNRHGYPMSFMMIDVDHFKSYNDSFTHPEGDKALILVGQILKETLRGADVAARYGGEEFSILLPQTNTDEAVTIAERIRKNIEAKDFPNRRITVSIGISSASRQINTPEDLILAADKALYLAKDQGRNNVQIFQNTERNLQVS